jgi:hypothetical protein
MVSNPGRSGGKPVMAQAPRQEERYNLHDYHRYFFQQLTVLKILVLLNFAVSSVEGLCHTTSFSSEKALGLSSLRARFESRQGHRLSC